MGSKTHRVSNVLMLLALSAGLAVPTLVRADPVDKVKLKVWLKSLSIIDDMDDRLTRGCGDLCFAWNVGVEGQSGSSTGTASKNSDGKPYNICDNSTLGLNTLLVDKDLCCPIPDLEVVLDFYDDDDSTAEVMSKVATTLGGIAAGIVLGADGKPISDGLEAVRKALDLEGKPTSDSMGTAVDLDAHPPGDCIFCDALDTSIPVKLNGGTGSENGTATLSWKACKIGTCAPIPCDSGGPPPHPDDGNNIEKAGGGQSSDDEIDLHIGVSDDVLTLPMLNGDTRDFNFGIDSDLNSLTGSPSGSLGGCEFRVRLRQTSNGIVNTPSTTIEQWNGAAWAPTGIPVLGYLVRPRDVTLYVSHQALGLGANFAVMMQLVRNGAEMDVEPNNQMGERHHVTWLQAPAAGEAPYVVAVRQILDVPEPQYHLRYTFNENVSIGPTPIQIAPFVPVNVQRSFRTLDVQFQLPPGTPSAQVFTLQLLPAQVIDFAANQLDGNIDGVAGDAHVQNFDPVERRLKIANNGGIPRNEFLPGEQIFVSGSQIPGAGAKNVYLVANDAMQPGAPLVDLSADHQPANVFISAGSFPLTAIGPALRDGEFDIVLDMNSNGTYEPATDLLGVGEGIGINVGRLFDCNGNGVRDSVDIVLGTSQDADGDGIPDECIACRGDLNFDGWVDDADFVIFVNAYNMLLCTDDLMPPHCQSDLNRDGLVEDGDFVIFVTNYNVLICPS